ncbi:hypothetical protein JCM19241_1421 [Vibrio ishigakensis]|uniref:Cyclic nucleotide-binding domain-containing protein n=1 Tax=Vibrio ishigakensis TaxID=1481914 RepID=A0A0B8QIV9_9VIBR|nr:hypothetical protein JCM19241_1421 [Vibrio ishigakensis]
MSISPLPHQLSKTLYPELFNAFQNHGKRVRYSHGQTIVGQFEKPDYMGILIEGVAEAHITSADGNSYIAEQLQTGWVFNAACYLDNGASPAEALSINDCTLLTLPFSVLRKHPALKAEATQLAAYCVVQLYRRSEVLFTSAMLLPLEERILRRLNTLKDKQHTINITTDKLASYLGESKFKVYREIKRLEQNKVLSTGYGTITLHQAGLLD